MPELVAEVSFAGWTKAGRIRHSVFHGLRIDKPANLITREKALATKGIINPETIKQELIKPAMTIEAKQINKPAKHEYICHWFRTILKIIISYRKMYL